MRNIELGFSWVVHFPILDFSFLQSGNAMAFHRAPSRRWHTGPPLSSATWPKCEILSRRDVGRQLVEVGKWSGNTQGGDGRICESVSGTRRRKAGPSSEDSSPTLRPAIGQRPEI